VGGSSAGVPAVAAAAVEGGNGASRASEPDASGPRRDALTGNGKPGRGAAAGAASAVRAADGGVETGTGGGFELGAADAAGTDDAARRVEAAGTDDAGTGGRSAAA
jgi:hypothetical protein